MSSLIVTEKPYHSTYTIYYGEDFAEALPRWINPFTDGPFDFTGVAIEWVARPSFNHTTRFVMLSIGQGIVVDDAVDGLISIFYRQADVETNLPLSIGPYGWTQFMRFRWNDALLGSVTKIVALGPLFVFPSRDDA